jgi:MFS family permease
VNTDVRRNVRLLGWFNFLLDFRLYAPVMVIYFERITGSYTSAMSILSMVMLSSALLEVPTGIYSDKIGRRQTLILGTFASLVSVICYAIGLSYWFLFLGAIFEGLGRALFSGNNDSLLHDTLTELNERGEYQEQLGRVSSAFQFALGISAVVGSILATWSFAIVMWLSVLPKLVMATMSFRFVEPQIDTEASSNMIAHLRDTLQQFGKNKRLRMLTIAEVISFSTGEASFQFRTVFIEMLWPLWAIGVARAISNACAALSFLFSGKLIKRFGERRLLFGGMGLSELLNVTALILNSVVSPALMGATSIFYGVNAVSTNGMLQRHFSDAQRSTMGSLTSFAGSISFAILSLALGWLADQIGVQYALIIVTIFGLVRLIFYSLALKKSPEVREQLA